MTRSPVSTVSHPGLEVPWSNFRQASELVPRHQDHLPTLDPVGLLLHFILRMS